MKSLKILCAELSRVILSLDYDQEHCILKNLKSYSLLVHHCDFLLPFGKTYLLYFIF